ncbi:hypothetical protein FACS189451_12250 [Bacteroidia bacterium]|nr:hypothetical protein FACS189451_12250 [Bacteroidia bacterium]
MEKMKMKNVVLTNARGTLIRAINGNIVAENCEFSNSRDYLLDLTGGRYQFIHCTIANYYPNVGNEAGWGNTNNEILSLSDTASTGHYPVLGFDMANSIIAGRMPSSEISISMKQDPSEPFHFRNCVFTNNPSEKNYIHYTDCIFEAKADSLFKKADYTNEKREFWPVYDFGLLEKSPARKVADFEISKLIPLDIKGVNRLEEGLPDAGAYEFTPALNTSSFLP